MIINRQEGEREMDELIMSQRIKNLKQKMLSEKRYVSIEQALIITENL